MHPALSTNYIVPGLLLNPVLLLWSINTILSRVLPPIVVDVAIQPPPYYPLGPSAEHPHLDIHSSESLCWSYTAFIVFANLAAFGRVSGRREKGKERARIKEARTMNKERVDKLIKGDTTHINGTVISVKETVDHDEGGSIGSEPQRAQSYTESHTEESDWDGSSSEWY